MIPCCDEAAAAVPAALAAPLPQPRTVRRAQPGPGREPALPDDPGAAEPGPAYALPDFAAAVHPCLDDLPRLFRDAGIPVPEGLDVRASVVALAPRFGRQAEILPPRCDGSVETFGVWSTRSDDDPDARAARERGLASLAVLPDPPAPDVFAIPFAFRVQTRWIERAVAAAYRELPKRYDTRLERDPEGRIHLTGFGYSLLPPDRSLLTVSGFYEPPVGARRVRFTLRVEDTLAGAEVRTACSVHVERDALRGLALPFSPSALLLTLNPLRPLLLAGMLGQGPGRGRLDDFELGPHRVPSPGALAVAAMPREEMIPERLKLVFSYDRFRVDRLGVTGQGTFHVEQRRPSVSIEAPARIVAGDAGATVNLRAVARDLREPQTEWTAVNGRLSAGDGESPTLRVETADLAPGQVRRAEVRLAVTDADGLAAQASRFLLVERTTAPAPD